jgi:hypothetical protein
MRKYIIISCFLLGGCQSASYHNDIFSGGYVKSIGSNYYEYSGVFPAWTSDAEKKKQSLMRAKIYCNSLGKKYKEASYDSLGYTIIMANQSTLFFQCV